MSAGRKRSFNKDEALDKAMRVFWDNGYTGTSLTDLTSALGINKPSLYSAFGNKEKLFEASIEHYREAYASPKMQLLISPAESPMKERLQAYLYGIIDIQTNPDTPKGCFFVKSNCESGCDAFPSEISSLLDGMLGETENFITKFLETERERGKLPDDTSIKEATSYLMSVMYGLAVQARVGESKDALRSAADFAIRSFPSVS